MAKAQNAKAKKKGGNANRRNVWLLVLTTVLVLGSIFMFTPPQDEINQGLDIQGGLSVVLSAKSTDGDAVTSEDMEKSRAIIEQRVNALGASEAVVQLQGSDQILVQIPGLSDTETALSTIGKTGKLEFARLDSFTDEDVKTKIENGQYGSSGTITDDFGNTLPSGKTEHLTVEEGTYTPLITGSNITKVDIGRASETGTDYSVNISLDSEGTKAFADATKDLASTKGKIVIILDGEVQSAPAVQSEITGGQVSITGGYDKEAASSMETVLESGSLPVSFEYAQSQVPGGRPDARPGCAYLRRAGGCHRPCAGHAVPAGVLPGSGLDHRGGHGRVRRAVPGHPGPAFALRPVQPVHGRHRRRCADHRHGGRLLHPYP